MSTRTRRNRGRSKGGSGTGAAVAVAAALVVGGVVITCTAPGTKPRTRERASASKTRAATAGARPEVVAPAAPTSAPVEATSAPPTHLVVEAPPVPDPAVEEPEVNEATGTGIVDVPGVGHTAWDIESEEPPPFYDETIRFPDDAGVIDVTKAPYNARGDGRTDCSDAIQRALDDYPAKNRIIYLPNGTYLVSHMLSWGPSKRLNPGKEIKGQWGHVHRLTILQGQNRDRTIIKLKDHCEEFQDRGVKKDGKPGDGRPVIYTGGWPAQRFRNAVRNLTIDTGRGNPAAIGMQFNASNQGCIHRVKIVSGDGRGTIGLDIGYCGDHGPASGRHIEIIGFDRGIRSHSMNGMTLWDVALSKQNEVGVHHGGDVLMLRRLRSDNSVPAVIVGPAGYAYLTLDDAQLRGGSADHPAILFQNGHFYARDVKAKGYGLTIENKKRPNRNASGDVAEYSARAPQKLFDNAVSKGLRLPVKYAPEIPWGDIRTEWANVLKYGAFGDGKADDTDGIQKAIDSGAKTVYFPGGHTFNFTEITLRRNVQRLIGCEAYLNGDRVYIRDNTAKAIIVERFHPSWGGGRKPHVYLEDDTTLILRDLVGWRPHHRGTGDLFIEDVCSVAFLERPGTRAWCRFFNYEPNREIGVVNNGGYLWLFGGKTEHDGPKMRFTNGSKSELLGSWWYASHGKVVSRPGIEIINSDATITGHRQFSFGKGRWPEYVVERRGATRKVWSDWNIEFFSARIEDDTPPEPPATVSARSDAADRVELTWPAASDPDSGIGMYRIYRDGELAHTVEDAGTRWTDTGLKENTTYAYAVSAVNWGGTASRGKSVRITTIPDTVPPELRSAFSSPDRAAVTVVFSEPVTPGNARGYRIDNGVTVSSAKPLENPAMVVLATSELATGVRYTLSVKGVSDRASKPNAIAGDATVGFYAAGDGLLGTYFSDKRLQRKAFERVDPQVRFSWGGSPGRGVGNDNWSARWTGTVVPAHSEVYTFYTKSDDGSRLWVDGRQVVGQWRDQGPTEKGGAVALEAGRSYPIRLEFYESAGGAMCELWWQSPSTPKQIVPKESLYSGKQ